MESEDNEDRISQLPDSILHHILSKVPDFRHKNTIHLVRTCILMSKRWSNLWASFPHLYFKHRDRPGGFDYNLRLRESASWVNAVLLLRDTTTRLVNAVLLLRDMTDVESFYLRRMIDSGKHGPRRLVNWMQYAINHNVKDLNILVDLHENYFELPSGLFTCWSLEKLDLDITSYGNMCDGCIAVPGFVQLGRLRKLHLKWFSGNHDSLNALMSGCPALEDMDLTDCILQHPDICSNSLKKLKIEASEIAGRFRISVPSLQCLFLINNDIERSEVLLENLSSLARTSLQTDDCTGGSFGSEDAKLLKYISPINTVRCVTGSKLSELQTFHNLKELHFHGSIIIDNLPLVARFLHRSPNLELMTLHEEVVISLDPVLKKKLLKMDFGCPHLRDILATFDEKTDEISELLNVFCDDKCSCFLE